ncbi:MAG: DEAD/DEAH box helicase [Clostridiales bacterium]|nr:DEAD/DEAH box helicase [Clostridiales bacterium]
MDFNWIKRKFGENIYDQGLDLYLAGQVGRVKSTSLFRRTSAYGIVEGASCEVTVDANRVYSVSCRKCEGFLCPHACAVLIKLASINDPKALEAALDEDAAQLIGAYETKQSLLEGSVKLTPVLSFASEIPTAAFKIGGSRSYLIKGVLEFSRRMKAGETVTYGEGFTFFHDINAFDDQSRLLCELILNYASGLDAVLSRKNAAFREDFGDVRDIPLSGADLDFVFDLFVGRKLPVREGGSVLLVEDGYKLGLEIENDTTGLNLRLPAQIKLFSSSEYSYIFDLQAGTLTRLGRSKAAPLVPLLSEKVVHRGIRLSAKRAEDFCQKVLPALGEFTQETSLVPLERFMPEELSVRFLLDMPQRGLLTCQPNFTYGERFVEVGAPEEMYPDIRRDLVGEEKAISALNILFDSPKDKYGTYSLSDEDRMYELLKDGGKALEPYGEVYVSDRLRRTMNPKAPRPVVRAGVRGGMLQLNLECDGFPPEELEKLLKSVREKRKYYRIQDGGFISLENGKYSTLASTLDSLNISADALNSGKLVPLYKALFLDEALKNESDAQLRKDEEYKRLARDFRAYEDGDFSIPSPLDGVLREYQKTGFMWLRTLDKYSFGGILADDMGLGKTLQVLAYILSLKKEGERGTFLICCPASVTISWLTEAEKWTPELKRVRLCGTQTQRENLIRNYRDYDLIVSSYDLVRNDIALHEKNVYRAVVLDEAQYIKNRETKLFKGVKKLNAMTRIALSGTPIENSLSELHSIFDFLMPGYLGSYSSFRERFETPITEHQDEAKKRALGRLVSPFILRRMKKDVLSELPPKTETNCYIEMGDRQRELYAAYVMQTRQRMESASASDKLQILAMLTRLRQICCDPALCFEGYEDASCKKDECVRMTQELIENRHRVLIFSQFTTMLSRIESSLTELGISCFTLKGDTPIDERSSMVNAFNSGKRDVFLISLKAGGTGLNLTGADTVIHFDPWWNISAQNQATDRCYRIGQEKAVQVYKLIASDTIEENIVKLQYRKLELAGVVNENADGSIMNLSSEELLELLK